MWCIVVFEGDEKIGILRFLRKGFRHCFICIVFEQYTVILDPKKYCSEIRIIDNDKFQEFFDNLLRSKSFIFSTFVNRNIEKKYFLRIFSCVNVVNSVMKFYFKNVLTPFQMAKRMLFEKHWYIVK